jgi:hypothetical protein
MFQCIFVLASKRAISTMVKIVDTPLSASDTGVLGGHFLMTFGRLKKER